MTDAIFFRLGGELILVFHIQNGPGLDPNHRRRGVTSIAKFGFSSNEIRRCY
jgi:hypothetical protein